MKNRTKIGIFSLLLGLFLVAWGVALRFPTEATSRKIFISPVWGKATSPQMNIVGISIGNAGINVGVVKGEIRNGLWDLPLEPAVHLKNSAYPGQAGRIIIYGHNSQKVFGRLKKVAVGDLVTLTTKGGTGNVYRVSSVLTVNPDQVEVLDKSEIEILTVYTCTGIFDSQRLIVNAFKLGQVI